MFFNAPAVIQGRWNHHTYQIEKVLGQGANGQVFLVWYQQKRYALKVGHNAVDLMPEIKVLRELGKVQGETLGPSLHDVDDVWWQGQWASFYVMDWIEGQPLHEILQARRLEKQQAVDIIVSVLDTLEKIHAAGYCFGDIKPENIIIGAKDHFPYLIDFGGVTPFYRSVRQYTEHYDRGTWQAGLRQAEPSYDLFSVAVLFLEVTVGLSKNHSSYKERRHWSALYDIIRKQKFLRPFLPVFQSVLAGKYREARTMREDIKHFSHSMEENNQERWVTSFFVFSCMMLGVSLVLYL